MQAYDGPLKATPIMNYNSEILSGCAENGAEKCKVIPTNSPTERLKWRYLFETGRIAWSKLLIDPHKVRMLRARNAAILELRRRRDATFRTSRGTGDD